ncbi:hypothetical protein ACFLSA_00765 [Bacteroidota bacterium]
MKKPGLIILLSIFSITIKIQGQLPVFVTDSLENYIKKGMQEWQIPGMAISIVKDGKIVFMKGYGTREVGKNEKS